MNPWVMLVIGLVVGAIIGALAGRFNKMVKDDSEFNERGEYRCNYNGEDEK